LRVGSIRTGGVRGFGGLRSTIMAGQVCRQVLYARHWQRPTPTELPRSKSVARRCGSAHRHTRCYYLIRCCIRAPPQAITATPSHHHPLLLNDSSLSSLSLFSLRYLVHDQIPRDAHKAQAPRTITCPRLQFCLNDHPRDYTLLEG
jgi:hypothetical protein